MRLVVTSGCSVTQSVYRGILQARTFDSAVHKPLCARPNICVRLQHKRTYSPCKRRTFVHTPEASAAPALVVAQLPSMLQAILSPAVLTVTILSTVAISAWASARRKTKRSEITTQPTDFNKGVLSRCPTIKSPYQAWPLLTNGHVETIFASKTRQSPPVEYDRHSFGCPDGGTVHLDYHRLPGSIVGSISHTLLLQINIATASCTTTSSTCHSTVDTSCLLRLT